MSFRKTIFDTMLMSMASAMRLLAQFIAVPIMSRILSPHDYGLVGMSMPFIFFAMILADAGIGVSIVRTPLSERKVWSTCFWISILLGLLLAACMIISAPLFAIAFNEPRIEPIIQALSIVVIIQGLFSVPGSALQQAQKFKLMAGTEIAAIVTGIVVAVVVAKSGGGAWALVYQQVAFYSVRASLLLWYSPFRPLRVFDLHSVKEHMKFGKDVLNVNLFGFLSRSLDSIVIGRVIGAASVGIYTMALQFARLPIMLISGPMQFVLYSKLAPVKDDIQAIRQTYLILTRILALLIFPSMAMVAVAYQPVFVLLLSEKWEASGEVFALVAAACSLQAVTSLNGTVRLVMGRADMQFRAALEQGLLWIVVLLVSVHFGTHMVAIAFSLTTLAYMPRALQLSLPLIECAPILFWRALSVPLVAAFAGVVAYCALRTFVPMNLWFQLLSAILLAIAGIGLGALLQHKTIMRDIKLFNDRAAAKP